MKKSVHLKSIQSTCLLQINIRKTCIATGGSISCLRQIEVRIVVFLAQDDTGGDHAQKQNDKESNRSTSQVLHVGMQEDLDFFDTAFVEDEFIRVRHSIHVSAEAFACVLAAR